MFKELDLNKLPIVTLNVPKGESAANYVEGYFGINASRAEEMPADEDVEGTTFIKLA